MESIGNSPLEYNRKEIQPAIHFQNRDEAVLQTIFEFGGVLAKRQLKEMFWPDKSWRAMEIRLSKLYHNGYLDWPDPKQRRSEPIPEPVCWLGWRGALEIAARFDQQIDPPRNTNENQLRILETNLRKQGFHWLREPHWSILQHDLAVIDFKIQVEDEVAKSTGFLLENWKFETEFRSDPDVITYTAKDRNGVFRQLKKRVLPDAYFEIIDRERQMKGEASRVRFLLELDRATHDNPSFGREKIAAGLAYIKSSAFKSRFGSNNGRWLIVTSAGQTRLRNLMFQTKEHAGQEAGWFFFTSTEDLVHGHPLTSPVWRQIGSEEPRALLGV